MMMRSQSRMQLLTWLADLSLLGRVHRETSAYSYALLSLQVPPPGAEQAVDGSKTQERWQRESGAQVQLVEEEGVEEVARGILAQWPPLLVTVLRV